ncbi:hypothetical protein J3D56_001458 [Erwinia persicina]|uniref:Transcriptional regulator n=2 Tax=Erwinia TaxID=551 RepID=A0ABV4E7H9_9GAMM|nr:MULTISPECIES: hypothetical protein [Erwinia]MCP1438022.1 hypothetical protein [Erwinia persicina]MDN4626606.1 hypothetical protein [Erwinia sp. PsM31]MDN8542993.1 hypothetical protein [Erwinia sp. BC051422]
MHVQELKRMAREEEAHQCWDKIGKAILNRGKTTPGKSVSYKPGMTVEDFLSAANRKQR